MNESRDELHILAPRETKPKLDYVYREVQRASGGRFTRREALGLAGLAILAAACGKTNTTSSGGSTSAPGVTSSKNPLTGAPLEDHLEIYNWQEYDDPSTYTKFKKLPDEAKAGLTI